jgi:hypothetical protein
MKTIISILTAIMIVCLPKFAVSDPATINGNVSIWQYDGVPLVGIVTTNSGYLSMDNFDIGAEYKILITQDAPNLVQNLDIVVGLTSWDSGSVFTFAEFDEFNISYYLPPGTPIGQTQLLKFEIRKHIGLIWDWQSTFYYYVNTTCPNAATLTQGFSPLPPQDYEVTSYLSVSSSVSPVNGLAEFDAGQSVTLLPGFVSILTGTGAVSVIIDGCGGSYRLFDPAWKEEENHGLETADKNTNIAIYPNPTNDLISVLIPNAVRGEKIKVELRDINGRLLKTEDKLYEPDASIDLKELKPGLYFITISGTALNYNHKIIKQ